MNPFRRRRPLLLPLAALLFLAGSAAAQPFSETLFSEMRWRMIGPFRGGRTVAAISFRDWHPVGAEEYGYVAPDPLGPDVVYGGKLTRFRHSTGDVKDVSPAPVLGKYRFLRTAPVLFSPADPHVLRTHDGGKTWKEIVKGLPDDPVNAVREDPVKKGLLYAGTERMVHVSFDDGETWQPLRLNMPATSIRDLVVHGDDLVVGTHGRGFWILDDVTPLRQLDAKTDSARPRRRASLEEKLLHLYGIIESADDAPTAQAVAAVDELTAR